MDLNEAPPVPPQEVPQTENGQNEQIQPNQTIYLNNLNERIKKEEIRKSLYAMFTQFGTVLDVVALKTLEMRGQAFVVFKDTASATNAMRSMQNFPFYDKPMHIQYSKSKSDIIAKMEGNYVPREKKKKEKRKKTETEGGVPAEEQKKAKKPESTEGKGREESVHHPKQQPPNKILFVENLPDAANELMLGMLFQQFLGFKEVRMVAGKPGIAFVEFENEREATAAMQGLQHFKITPSNLMVINYAKK